MNFNRLNRKVHYWVAVMIALPALVIITTGLLLQVKKHWAWVQPLEQKGTGMIPRVDFAGILESVRQVQQFEATEWDDINRLDVRPDRGTVKVLLDSGWEIQVDLGTGRVIQSAYRRSDWIESLHDGSFLAGDWSKLGIFLPCGVGLLALLVTGLWLSWLPIAAKRNAGRLRHNRQG